jgi:hypothetical protein
MLTTRLLICLGILAPATPALGAQFFIMLDSATNQCIITEQAPDRSPGGSNPLPTSPPYPIVSSGTPSPSASTNAVLVGDGAYGDWAAAEADMRAIAACAANRQ